MHTIISRVSVSLVFTSSSAISKPLNCPNNGGLCVWGGYGMPSDSERSAVVPTRLDCWIGTFELSASANSVLSHLTACPFFIPS